MWATKRKMIVWLFLFIVFLITLFFSYKIFFDKDPTCFDGIKNGKEEGVDCGGACEAVCAFHATDVNVFWARTFSLNNGYANIAALLENPNFDYALNGMFAIKVYDKNNIRIIDMKKHISFVPAEKKMLFLPTIYIGKAIPAKTFVSFEDVESVLEDKAVKSDVYLISKFLEYDKENDVSRMTISVGNDSLVPIKNIEVSVILYGKQDKVINAGQTFIDILKKRDRQQVYITWPGKFDEQVIKTDVFIKEIK